MSPATLDMQALQYLRSEFSKALKDFAGSPSSFRILHTIPPTSAPSHGKPIPTRTLYVLDSSFNPPSKAHSSLVKTALRSQRSKSERKGQSQSETPRVLFLLATVNADKKPKPADFEDRIVMMALAAQDLRSTFSSNGPSTTTSDSASSSSSDPPVGTVEAPIIDIGITKQPYFVDKASAIRDSNVYENPDREDGVTEQIHLTGFDTLLRIFTPKYYPKHDPPLSALEPFLEHHRVRATIRVDPDSPSANLKDAQKTEGGSSSGAVSSPDFSTPEGQSKYLQGIREGALEQEGMKREWSDRVELVVDEEGEAQGVSSTKVRDAVKEGNWAQVRELVGASVGDWIKERGLYLEGEASGKL
ncbi:hypothetical protein A1O7_06601 [Cladophialophora yegresii CBS 114405]|uniref:Nicotinamide-nucleotide adenylyltransferase n=1 Tax=Cladophialophora yegresii CBS 114405 TaxID=1182544 RepID=W9WL22_9EURO|nr:uncharacterized protein A1O7_06601 [Cladophialophora yegresii CBS 114405]EXJ59169.1 hypothetical protein A1O7_06601 [Cladophialophora yegresii CBS 114405]